MYRWMEYGWGGCPEIWWINGWSDFVERQMAGHKQCDDETVDDLHCTFDQTLLNAHYSAILYSKLTNISIQEELHIDTYLV